jgi:cell division protein ZapA (FtsZ GTPase activity inhibitor)
MTAWRSTARSIALFALLALPLFSGACSAEAPVLELDRNWKVTFSDSSDYAAPGHDDSNWQTISLPAKLSTEKKRQTIWLRTTFTIPPELRDRELALYLGKIWDADRTYLNGELVGSTGSEPPDYFAAWNFDRNYRLPASVLHRDKPNVIAVRVYTGQLALFNGQPLLGEAGDIAKHTFRAELKARYLALAGGVLTLIFGLISFIRFLFDHKDRPSLLYAIMSFLWSIQSLHFVLPDFGISYNAHDKIYYIIMACEVLCIYKFLEVFLGKKHKVLSIAVYVISAISIIICFTATDDSPMMGWRSDVIGAIGLLIQVFWLATILMAIRKTEARIILGAYVIFMITLGHDALAISGAISYDFFWMNLGYPAVIIAFGAILALQAVLTAQELAVAHDQLRDYANHLEEKVEDRTRQLSEAKEEIEAAMHELEAMNDNLVRTNRDLEDAQRIAAMDMRMAAQCSAAFFHRPHRPHPNGRPRCCSARCPAFPATFMIFIRRRAG